MAKSIIIIGSGLSGLAAGITLQKKGYMTQIFERAPWAGGVCASWMREGYVFDAGMHSMIGTKKQEPLYAMYEYVDALNETIKVHHIKEIHIEVNQVSYTIPMQIHAFSHYLIKQFPKEERFIKTLIEHLSQAIENVLFISKPSIIDYKDHVRSRFLLKRLYLFYQHISVSQALTSIEDDQLRSLLYHLLNKDQSMVEALINLAQYFKHNRGIPEGGAKGVVSRMESLYRNLGGRIHFNHEVSQIVVQKGKVSGVRVNHVFIEATHIIATCDKHIALRLLTSNPIVLAEENPPNLAPFVIVSLGLDKPFHGPSHAHLESQEGVWSGFNVEKRFTLRSYDYEKMYHKPGQGILMAFIKTPFQPWLDLYHLDKNAYDALKEDVKNALLDELEKRYEGIKKTVIVSDVATPMTYQRLFSYDHLTFRDYTLSNYTKPITFNHRVKDVKHLYLAGQSITSSGGIALVIKSGIDAANKI